MELKSLPYVYSLMGIITVLCKGFILLCSMHKKCSQPYDFQICIIHLFLQGKLNNFSFSWSLCISSLLFATFYCHVKKLHTEQIYSHTHRQLPWNLFLNGVHFSPNLWLCLSPYNSTNNGSTSSSICCWFLTDAAPLPVAQCSCSFMWLRERTYSLSQFLLCIWCFYPPEWILHFFFQ